MLGRFFEIMRKNYIGSFVKFSKQSFISNFANILFVNKLGLSRIL